MLQRYDVIKILEKDSIGLFKKFSDKQMKASKNRFHLIVSTNGNVSIKFDDT